MHCRRWYRWVAAALTALALSGCGGSRHKPSEADFRYSRSGLIPVSGQGSALAAFATTAVAAELGHLPVGTSAVAWADSGSVRAFASPHARVASRSFPARDQFGITQVFLVKRAIPGWLEVYLPVRPNGSTGWVRAASVGVELDPYRVVVDTAAHSLEVLHAGRGVLHAPVGIGKAATPTPRGLFYIIEMLRMVPSTGPYGTYAFGLSAFSDTLTTFGTGEAQIALHGTDEPASIGQNTSNGCVHMSNAVANWLARTVPLGTPVQIV
jgi:lipoprotein-anchoring transpeptidase ErfK/SrfK